MSVSTTVTPRESTVGKKTARGLETIICTGLAFTPEGPGQAVFEFVLLP